jgi:hypothetical protein
MFTPSFGLSIVTGLIGAWCWMTLCRPISLGPISSLICGACGGILSLLIAQGLTDMAPNPFIPFSAPTVIIITMSSLCSGAAVNAICGMIKAGIEQISTEQKN